MPHEYPRPQLCRSGWLSLNGPWQFGIDWEGRLSTPHEVTFDRVIEVPYAPETTASGIAETGLFCACWYRRQLEVPPLHGERFLLHFGAVDYRARVWLDGVAVADHEGGYTPFTVDLTEHVAAGGVFALVVRAEDDPADLAKPRGKQDWQEQPHSIWYPRTSGIWQTVWAERVPATYVQRLVWRSNLERWEMTVSANIAGEAREGMRLEVKLSVGDRILADDSYSVSSGEVERSVALSDPGIDDSRNELLWRPGAPTLIQAGVQLRASDGTVLDSVASYTALRAISVSGDRFLLNGRPCPLRLVLDQGYWPDTGATAPDDDALRQDVQLALAMGFNGVRKHQKIEDPRYLYWADCLGLLVWEEMPSAYRFTASSVQRLTKQWLEVLERDRSHPCIVAWVPFNESWGVPNLPDSAQERHYVQAIYHLTRTLDPTRPVIGNDGWESSTTDIIGIHDYDANPAHHRQRYAGATLRQQLLRTERPGGRSIVLSSHELGEQPLVLSEFGGIAYAANAAETWGYSRCATPDELRVRYTALLAAVRSIPAFCGFCYTQFADTYQEANGLLYANRTPKFPLDAMRVATRGADSQEPDQESAAISQRKSEGPRQKGHILDD